MCAARFAALALAVVFPASFTWGQNLVLNPNFDIDVAGWAALTTATIEWSPLDAEGNPASGSALVANLSTTANDSTGAIQCIEGINGESLIRFAADVMIPGGQLETGHAHLLVQWYDESECGGAQVGLATTTGIYTTEPDVWYTDFDFAEAPLGAQSARLRLSVWKNEDSGTLQAHFDDVSFVAVVFVDSFESGDTTAWSATVP